MGREGTACAASANPRGGLLAHGLVGPLRLLGRRPPDSDFAAVNLDSGRRERVAEAVPGDGPNYLGTGQHGRQHYHETRQEQAVNRAHDATPPSQGTLPVSIPYPPAPG